MPRLTATLAFLLLCTLARAQETIPPEHAQRVGKHLAEVARQVDDPQIKADVDPEKAAGIKADQRGALAIPARDLSEETLARGDKKVVALGHLWFRGITPVIEGQSVDRSRLRPMKVKVGDEEHELFLFLLGAARKDSGDWELLVYGKDKDPLARLALKKADGGARETPIALDGKKNDNGTGDLTVNVLGKYSAVVTVGEAPE